MVKKIYVAGVFIFAPVLSYAALLPDTPVPFKSGVGVMDNEYIYVGLGSAGKSWYRIDMRDAQKQWKKIADFPGVAREQAVSAMLGGKIYVFGGVGKERDGKTRSLNDAYSYDPGKDTWTKLSSHYPQSFIGSASFVYKDKLFVMGGVNQNIFNGYFDDITRYANDADRLKKINNAYFGKKSEDYFYSKSVLSFSPLTQQWSCAGMFPYGTAGATIIVNDKTVSVINGEVKPGLRTDAVYSGNMDALSDWKPVPPVNAPDGVAGGFGGVSDDYLLFAGGAGFKGARKNYDDGNYYAHEGLKKYYSDEVKTYKAGRWSETIKLPYGVAYGVSIPWRDGLLMIGGETSGGNATSKSIYLKINHGKVDIID